MAHSTRILPVDFTPISHANLDAETRLTYEKAAVFVANRVEAEVRKTTDPAAALTDILGVLPAVFPQALESSGTPDVEALAPMLLPEVTARLQAFTRLYRARTGAQGAYAACLDEVITAVREGATLPVLGELILAVLGHADKASV
ncbi:hypothetical protein [Streptomyces griseofuscus]|uniref:hypothetical protein n=1 Tax=Streptomyces griseofuscus TaxID=146922 RepID=UPI0034535A45